MGGKEEEEGCLCLGDFFLVLATRFSGSVSTAHFRKPSLFIDKLKVVSLIFFINQELMVASSFVSLFFFLISQFHISVHINSLI